VRGTSPRTLSPLGAGGHYSSSVMNSDHNKKNIKKIKKVLKIKNM